MASVCFCVTSSSGHNVHNRDLLRGVKNVRILENRSISISILISVVGSGDGPTDVQSSLRIRRKHGRFFKILQTASLPVVCTSVELCLAVGNERPTDGLLKQRCTCARIYGDRFGRSAFINIQSIVVRIEPN
jgi:hypothetical protein